MGNRISEKSVVAGIKRIVAGCPNLKIKKRRGGVTNAGEPDLYGSIAGLHFELEAKAPGGKLTELQKKKLKTWRNTTAIVGVPFSAKEALEILIDGLEQYIYNHEKRLNLIKEALLWPKLKR